jgi:hypothetical protein
VVGAPTPTTGAKGRARPRPSIGNSTARARGRLVPVPRPQEHGISSRQPQMARRRNSPVAPSSGLLFQSHVWTGWVKARSRRRNGYFRFDNCQAKAVPDLTRRARIQLNKRVPLQRTTQILSLRQSRGSPRPCQRRPPDQGSPLSLRGAPTPPKVVQRNRRRAGSCGIGCPVIARAAYSIWRAASRAARAISRIASSEKFARSRH